jgi:hypothetical protein
LSSRKRQQRFDAHERARLDADTINNITQTVALLAVGAWAVYTFIYQEMIAPAPCPGHPYRSVVFWRKPVIMAP